MKQADGKPVLAIGIDAAEPTLVRRLIEQGELPALKDLLEGGTWHHVESPSHIDSGAVWPSFLTGKSLSDHGVYGDLDWNTESMSLTLYEGHDLTPFWEDLERNGTPVGILDVPYAQFAGLSRGFEVFGWGAHHPPEAVEGRTKVSPAALLDVVTKSSQPHPFSSDRLSSHDYIYVAGPEDYSRLTKISSDCLAGVQRKGRLAARLIAETSPELAVVVFQEVHHAGHVLWHTVAPEHPLFEGEAFRKARVVSPTLLDIYRETDRQIARLVEVAGSEATVLVFSLHGMEPVRGVPTILDPLLHEMGLARFTNRRARSWGERVQSVLQTAWRRTPPRLKKLYHRIVPSLARDRLRQPTFLPAYDWSRTRAFALPTHQHGWIRLNVLGRETQGIVSPEQYDETCDLIEEALRALTTDDGRPIVRDVLRLSRGAEEALPHKLPDLVVHWDTAAFDFPVRIKNSPLRAYPSKIWLTGNHASDGFCIIKRGSSVAGNDIRIDESIAVKDLHRLMVSLTVSRSADGPQSTATSP